MVVLMVGSSIAGHYEHIRHDLLVILDFAALYIFLSFFVMTGAGLRLDQMITVTHNNLSCHRYISSFIASYSTEDLCSNFLEISA